jgi:hypothetical protein
VSLQALFHTEGDDAAPNKKPHCIYLFDAVGGTSFVVGEHIDNTLLIYGMT